MSTRRQARGMQCALRCVAGGAPRRRRLDSAEHLKAVESWAAVSQHKVPGRQWLSRAPRQQLEQMHRGERVWIFAFSLSSDAFCLGRMHHLLEPVLTTHGARRDAFLLLHVVCCLSADLKWRANTLQYLTKSSPRHVGSCPSQIPSTVQYTQLKIHPLSNYASWLEEMMVNEEEKSLFCLTTNHLVSTTGKVKKFDYATTAYLVTIGWYSSRVPLGVGNVRGKLHH
jgi:hypothetical protein